MDDQVLNLLMKRIDDFKEDVNRRFDAQDLTLSKVQRNVTSISEWRWKIAGGVVVAGIMFAGVWEASIAVIEHMHF